MVVRHRLPTLLVAVLRPSTAASAPYHGVIAVFASDVERVGTGTSRQTLLLGFRSGAGATAVAYAVNLAVLPFVLHRVGPHVYGAWATIASLLAIGGLADAGVRLEIVRRVAKARGAEDDDALVAAVHEGVTVLVLLASLVLVAGLTGAPFIRAFAFPDGVAGYTAPALDGLVRSVFALVAASLVLNGYFGVLRGVQRADVEATAQVGAVVVAAAVTVVGIAGGWGLWALLAGSLAQLAVVSAWKWVGTRRLIPNLRPRLLGLGRARVRSYLALSGLVLVAQVADVVDFQWDKLVLSHFVGSAVVASYHVGTGLVLQAKALAMLPMAPLVVAVAELGQRDAARLHALTAELVRVGMVLGSVVLGGLYAFAPAFFHLWLGPDVPPGRRRGPAVRHRCRRLPPQHPAGLPGPGRGVVPAGRRRGSRQHGGERRPQPGPHRGRRPGRPPLRLHRRRRGQRRRPARRRARAVWRVEPAAAAGRRSGCRRHRIGGGPRPRPGPVVGRPGAGCRLLRRRRGGAVLGCRGAARDVAPERSSAERGRGRAVGGLLLTGTSAWT